MGLFHENKPKTTYPAFAILTGILGFFESISETFLPTLPISEKKAIHPLPGCGNPLVDAGISGGAETHAGTDWLPLLK